MARDGLSIKLEGGALLDRQLAKMQKRVGTKIINASLNKGAAEVRKEIKKGAPKDQGELKKAVKNKVNRKIPNKTTFMASVFFKFDRNKGSNTGSGGWYSIFNIRRHKKNAFGHRGGNDFVTPAVKRAEPRVRRVIGTQVAEKIAAEQQRELNAKLK